MHLMNENLKRKPTLTKASRPLRAAFGGGLRPTWTPSPLRLVAHHAKKGCSLFALFETKSRLKMLGVENVAL